jgi:hypothetical protein
MVYLTSTSPKEFLRDVFLENTLKRAASPLDLIHSDFMGPFPLPSINKERYMLIFVDDLSCFTWIFFIRKKSEVFQHFIDFKALVETQSRKKIKILQTDNRGEYVNH